jgi:hypothetical protein
MQFDLNKMSGDDAKSLVKSLATGFQATIQNQQVSSEKLISTLVLDLSVARSRTNALKVSFPFVSLRVEEASDTLANCRVIPATIDSYQDDTLLKLNDSLEFDNGISSLYITNLAQSGKSMIIKFYTTARVRSGSLVLADNSAITNITLGEATAQNDGLTLLGYVGLAWAAGAIILNSPMTCYNDINIEAGSFTIGGLTGGHFKVPNGYTAEVLGAEIDVDTAIGSTGWQLFLSYAIEGETFANTAAFVASPRGVVNFNGAAFGVQSNKKLHPLVTGAGGGIAGSSRPKRLFYSDELIIPVMANYVAPITGVAQISILIRLTKNVGA